jgi:uncharacterized protein (UPF0218 family)
MQLKLDKNYKLTDEAKSLIRGNNGKLIYLDEIKKYNPSTVFAVGDFTCDLLEKNNIDAQIMVFDLLTKRGEKSYPDRKGSIIIENPAGIITGKLIETIKNAMEGNRRIKIRIIGEEDLAVLPIIFYAPVNSLIVYGIPDTGTGSIRVNEQVKQLTEEIMLKMEVI